MERKLCEKIIRLLVRVACPSYEWNELTERTKAWEAGCNMGYEAGLKGEPKPVPPPTGGQIGQPPLVIDTTSNSDDFGEDLRASKLTRRRKSGW